MLRAASTVLLLRDRAAGSGYEVFMVRRHQKSGFMAGAYVFPGGKLDEADCSPAFVPLLNGLLPSASERLGEDGFDEATARGLFVAGIRETLEEAGVLPGCELAQPEVDALREALTHGASLADELSRRGVVLELQDMLLQARWITPEQESRRYDTRFFVLRLPPGQQASHDRKETIDQAWWSPSEALQAQDLGEILLPPPTLRTLVWLCKAQSVGEVLDAVRASRPPCVRPVLSAQDEGLVIALPGDPLHPDPHPVLEGPTRLVLEGGRWWARGDQAR